MGARSAPSRHDRKGHQRPRSHAYSDPDYVVAMPNGFIVTTLTRRDYHHLHPLVCPLCKELAHFATTQESIARLLAAGINANEWGSDVWQQ